VLNWYSQHKERERERRKGEKRNGNIIHIEALEEKREMLELLQYLTSNYTTELS
jgi:hypothetical protein